MSYQDWEPVTIGGGNIVNDKKNILRGLMWKNFVHIKIETNKDVARDEFRFIKSKTGKDITNEMSLDKSA